MMRTLLLLPAAWLLASCSSLGSKGVDPRNFAVTTCDVQPNQTRIAVTRAQRYLERHPPLPEAPRYLAVEAGVVLSGDVQGLWIKLRASQTSATAFSQYKTHSVRLWCVLIVDRVSLRVVGNEGYVLNGTPSRGRVAKIGGYEALYVGTGH
jgi:hypothetical protein